MSTERGSKRLLSPGSATTVIPEDKRLKGIETTKIDQNTFHIAIMEPLPEEKELTLIDIKRYMDTILTQVNANGQAIKNLATKQDIIEINDQLTAHGTELDQLKVEVKSLKNSIKEIETNVDLQIAQKVNRMTETAGPHTGRPNFNMAAFDQNKPFGPSTKRRNLIFEGLPGTDGEEMKFNIIKVAEALNVALFASEIEEVLRMRRRDENDPRSGPVIATFARVVLRDAIISKKLRLREVEGMSQVYVNADNLYRFEEQRHYYERLLTWQEGMAVKSK